MYSENSGRDSCSSDFGASAEARGSGFGLRAIGGVGSPPVIGQGSQASLANETGEEMRAR
jgi:hypothetical protein